MARKRVKVLRTFGLPEQGFFAEGSEIEMEVAERCVVPFVPVWRYEQLKRAGLIEPAEHGSAGLTDKEQEVNDGEVQP